MERYKHSWSSVGSNRKHIQLTPKYRYKMMRKEKLKVFCRVAIEEACKRHKIEIEIIKVMPEHVHLIANLPRTMSDSRAMHLIKGLSSYLLFRICENLRRRYPKLDPQPFRAEGMLVIDTSSLKRGSSFSTRTRLTYQKLFSSHHLLIHYCFEFLLM